MSWSNVLQICFAPRPQDTLLASLLSVLTSFTTQEVTKGPGLEIFRRHLGMQNLWNLLFSLTMRNKLQNIIIYSNVEPVSYVTEQAKLTSYLQYSIGTWFIALSVIFRLWSELGMFYYSLAHWLQTYITSGSRRTLVECLDDHEHVILECLDEQEPLICHGGRFTLFCMAHVSTM
jgi:hypothetical protein